MRILRANPADLMKLGQEIVPFFARGLRLHVLHAPSQLLSISLIDWISHTLSQGYTNLQSLVKCLDHRDIYSMQSSKGCAMH